MNIKKQRIKIYLLFIFICLPNLSIVPSFAFQSREISMETVSSWAVTTTVFKHSRQQWSQQCQVKLDATKDADLYKIYRDNNLIGEAKGNTYDDYNLMVNKTFTYHIEAFYNGQKVATSISHKLPLLSLPVKVKFTTTWMANISQKNPPATNHKEWKSMIFIFLIK